MREDYILPDLDDNVFKEVLIASIKDYDKRKMISNILAELAAYGLERYNEKELRDVPEIRFLTNRIEEC